MPRTYRVVVARGGSETDGAQADRVARALRDGGFEVIYGSASAGPDQIAEAALQEDADAVGWPAGEGSDERRGLQHALASRGIDDVLTFSTEDDASRIVVSVARGLGVDGNS